VGELGSGKEGIYTMPYYLILCRSLTYAQRTAGALEQAGLSARVLRSPKRISGEGCSHSVRIKEGDLSDALNILNWAGLKPKRLFIYHEESGYKEVQV